MTKKIIAPPILPETFEAMVAPWLTGIAKKDIVAVMSYPSSDRQRRFLNLLDNHVLQKKYLQDPRKYLWVSVDFRVEPIDDVADLEAAILRNVQESTGKNFSKRGDFREKMNVWEQKYKKKVILSAFGCEELVGRQKIPILIWFTVMSRVDVLRMLLFFETNLFSPHALALFGGVPAFQPRISTLSLYQEKDCRQFIHHMTGEWKMRIHQTMEDKIIFQCGGLLLLIKESLWYLRDHAQASLGDVLSHTEMNFNVASLWQGFSKDERDVIDNIVKGLPLEAERYRPSIDYLVSVGIIKLRYTSHALTVPVLAKYRRDLLMWGKSLSLGDNNELLVDGISVSTNFSKGQRRVIAYLCRHLDTIISRDTVGQLLWPSAAHERYSDWAIDSQISRIRQRLERIGVYRNCLETVKGKGFLFHKNSNV